MSLQTTDLSKLSKQDLMALLERQIKENAMAAANRSSGLVVKKNTKGGITIMHPSFVAVSTHETVENIDGTKERKERKVPKEYTESINISANTAKALFGNPDILNRVLETLSTIL